MNDDKIEEILSSLESVSVPKHRTALRAALMREHTKRRQYFTLSNLTKFISMKTALIPVSSFAVLALILVGTFGATHKSAEAQELVQRSITAAARLAPEMRAQIEAQMKANMMETLKEAYAAPDLRILTKEEYEKEAQFTVATGTIGFGGEVHATAIRAVGSADVMISGENLPEHPVAVAFSTAGAVPVNAQGETGTFTVHVENTDGNVAFTKNVDINEMTPGAKVGSVGFAQASMSPPVKYLRYTAPDGRKVTLGLDESDTPVFRIEELTEKDIQHMPDGTIGIHGNVLHMIQVDTQNFNGGYGSAGAVHIEGGQQVK